MDPWEKPSRDTTPECGSLGGTGPSRDESASDREGRGGTEGRGSPSEGGSNKGSSGKRRRKDKREEGGTSKSFSQIFDKFAEKLHIHGLEQLCGAKGRMHYSQGLICNSGR